jgi:hypothetical protein
VSRAMLIHILYLVGSLCFVAGTIIAMLTKEKP